ncbi:hypothetical protein RvY_02304 [Ramazzottius varieornatus]|uniref:Uncharacterized protein n=1 Tax=Ramazzottius varieornatus TaxID=947166 RepID=A0A1D1UJ80_RAMVA|nr:hypothetical protein RvY_02304 [Ramazzottius varieornatus]
METGVKCNCNLQLHHFTLQFTLHGPSACNAHHYDKSSVHRWSDFPQKNQFMVARTVQATSETTTCVNRNRTEICG